MVTIAQLHEYRYASQAIHGQQDGAICRRPPQRVDRLQRTCSTRISCPRAIASSGSDEATDHALHVESEGASMGAKELFAPWPSHAQG